MFFCHNLKMAEELKKMGDNMKKKNPKRVMQLERYLSDTRIIMAIIIGIDLFFFMVMNFVINSLIAIPEMLRIWIIRENMLDLKMCYQILIT